MIVNLNSLRPYRTASRSRSAHELGGMAQMPPLDPPLSMWLGKHICAGGGCIPSGPSWPHPRDLPLRIAVVRSVALIIIVGRLTIVVCQHGGKMRTGPQAWSAVYPFAGPQVRILRPARLNTSFDI